MIIEKFLKKVILAFGLMIMILGIICPRTIYAKYAEKIIDDVVDVTFDYGWSYKESEDEAKVAALEGAKRRAARQALFDITGFDADDADNVYYFSREEIDDVINHCCRRINIIDEKTSWDRERKICTVEIAARVYLDLNDIIPSLPSPPHPEIDRTKAVPFINEDKRVHYYQIVDWGLDWHAAKEECEKEPRRHLVTIGSKEEQKFIEELLRNQGNRNCYWLGGEKVGKEKFFWVDNTPFTYTNWAKWQPDRPEEKALMIYKNQNPRAILHVLGTWADLRADGTFPNEGDFFGLDHFGFICEWDY